MSANIGRNSVDVETTFGTDQVYDWDAGDLPLIAGTYKPKLAEGILPNKEVTPRLHGKKPHLRGSKFGGGFTASYHFDSLPAILNAAGVYSHPQFNLALLLRAFMGGQRGGAGSVVVAGGDDRTIRVTDGTGVNFAEGGAALFGAPGDGRGGGKARDILSINTAPGGYDELILRSPLPGTPGVGDVVANSATFWCDPAGVGGDGDSLAFRFVGEDDNDQMIYRGCCGTFQIRCALDELLTMDVDVMAADWEPTSLEDLVGEALVGSDPITVNMIDLTMGLVGATTASSIEAHTFGFNPGLKNLPSRGGPIGTIWRYFQGKSSPSMQLGMHQVQHAAWIDFLDGFAPAVGVARSRYHAFAQIGNMPITSDVGTGVVCFSMPNIFPGGMPERTAGEEDFVDVNLNFDGGEDEDTDQSAEPTYLETAPFKIHCF